MAATASAPERLTSFRLALVYCIIAVFLAGIPARAATDPLIPLFIRKGEGLIRIANHYCVSKKHWKTIARINHLRPPYRVRDGATIRIPYSLLLTENLYARTVNVIGEVFLVKKNGEKTVLKKGDQLGAGEKVITGKKGYAELLFPGKKTTLLSPESELAIEYLFRLTDGQIKIELLFNRGQLLHSVPVKLRKGDSFSTRTPVAVTGVRGTALRLKMMDQETGITETLKGKVAVTAQQRQLIVPKGYGTRVKKGAGPETPRPLPPTPAMPVLKPLYRTLPISLPLEPAAENNIRRYHLIIAHDEQGRKIVQERYGVPGETVHIDALADGSYFIFLTAIDVEDFESLPAGPQAFKLRTSPAAPEWIVPDHPLKTPVPDIILRWSADDQAETYLVQVSGDREFHSLIREETLKTNQLAVSLSEPGTYFARVRVQTADGFTTLFSAPTSWTLLPTPVLLPSEAERYSGDSPIPIRWQEADDDCTYELQIAADRGFSQIVVQEKDLSGNSFQMDTYLDPGTYFIRIRAIAGDQQGPWSNVETILIDPPLNPVVLFILSLGLLGLIVL